MSYTIGVEPNVAANLPVYPAPCYWGGNKKGVE